MKRRVMIVEDDANIRRVLSLLFEANDWVVASAPNGRSGLQLARRVHPDVIVSDLKMPLMSGLEMARALSRDPEVADVPIVAMTSGGAELCGAAERSGLFLEVLRKPVEPEQLTTVVSQAVSAGSANEEPA